MSLKPISSAEARLRALARTSLRKTPELVRTAASTARRVADTFTGAPAIGSSRSAFTSASLTAEQANAKVAEAYRTHLRREGEAAGLSQWSTAILGLQHLGASAADIDAYLKTQFEGSPEFQALQLVDRTFCEELGRDVSGSRAYWHEEAVRLGRDEGMPMPQLEQWLRESFQSSPEYKHNHVDGVVQAAFEKMLSRGAGAGGYWHDEAHRMVDEGKSLEDIRAHLETSLSLSDEYRTNLAGQLVDGAFQRVLGRGGGTGGYWHDEAFGMLKAGRSVKEVTAHLEASLRGSDEYVLSHLDELVASKYREHLGREADPQGAAGWTALAEQWKAEGKSAAEIRAGLDSGFTSSDEYKRRHAPPPPASHKNENRSDFFLQQPNGWTCGPTSLTMALAQFGLRPASYATMWDLVAQTGTSAGVGLPGNASLLANAARHNGMKAEFSSSRAASDVRAQLEQGRGVIVNGSLTPGVGHFLYISGLDEQGRFIVCDPYRPGITRWNDSDLNYFTHVGSNPPGFAAVWR